MPIELYFEYTEPENYSPWVTIGSSIVMIVLWAAVVPPLTNEPFLTLIVSSKCKLVTHLTQRIECAKMVLNNR